MKKLIAVCLLMLFAVGCDKLKGEKGDKGDTGIPGTGGQIVKYEAALDSGNSSVVFDNYITPSDAMIAVYYEYPSGSARWFELGYPTGDNSDVDYPFAKIDYYNSTVNFFNIPVATHYKILIIYSAS